MRKSKEKKNIDVVTSRASKRGNSKGRASKEPSSKRTPAPKNKNTAKANIEAEKKIILIPVKIKKHADKNGGHNHIILEDIGDKHVSVGLTTKKKKGKNSPNYHCEVDPLGKGDESYMRRQGTVAPQTEYSKKEKSGAMSIKDYNKAKEYGDRAKKRYFEKKEK